MPRKIDRSVIAHAANLVLNGALLKDAAKEIGVHPAFLSRRFSEIGVSVPKGRGHPKTIDLPIDEIKAMYQHGESENAISTHFNVSRGTIRKRLLSGGVRPRSQHESEKLKWSKMDKEARSKQVEAAHNATRGQRRPVSAKIALAKTRQRIKYDHLIGFGEIEFLKLLSDRGIDAVHQKAIHIYNVDIAIGNIAVELTQYRGRYAMFNPKEIKRAENLLERGYHVVAVEFDSVESLIECTDDIIGIIDQARRLKPVDREYWVVGCRRQDYAIVKNNLGQFTRVPAPIEFLIKRTVIHLD